jgi:hypothetical protein
MAQKLTKKDVVLGGKIKCEGCGGEWWLSGKQAEYHRVNGFPTKCGNHPDVPGTGSGTHCKHEGEMTFIPYDIEENVRIFHEKGQHEIADAIPAQAAKLLAEVDD